MIAASARWRRLIAAGIDAVVLLACGLLLALVTGALEHAEAWVDPQPQLRIVLLAVVTYLAVNGYLLSKTGQTVGKRLLSIRIASDDGDRPALWQLALRAFVPFILMTNFLTPDWVGLIVVVDVLFIFTPSKRCLHDLLFGTQVVDASRDA